MIDNKIHPIPETSIEAAKIEKLQTRPNSEGLYGSQAFSPTELKKRMDALPILAIDKVNEIIDEMKAGGKVATTMAFKHIEAEYTLQELFDYIFNGGLSDMIAVEGTTLAICINDIKGNITYAVSALEQADTDNKTELERAINDQYNVLNKSISDVEDGANKAVSGLEADIKTLTDSLGNAFCNVSYDGATGDLTFSSINNKKTTLVLPLEMIVTSGEYNEETKCIELTLVSGGILNIPVSDLLTNVNTHIEKTVKDAVTIAFGEINDDLDELHAYAQALVDGGDS